MTDGIGTDRAEILHTVNSTPGIKQRHLLCFYFSKDPGYMRRCELMILTGSSKKLFPQNLTAVPSKPSRVAV